MEIKTEKLVVPIGYLATYIKITDQSHIQHIEKALEDKKIKRETSYIGNLDIEYLAFNKGIYVYFNKNVSITKTDFIIESSELCKDYDIYTALDELELKLKPNG